MAQNKLNYINIDITKLRLSLFKVIFDILKNFYVKKIIVL